MKKQIHGLPIWLGFVPAKYIERLFGERPRPGFESRRGHYIMYNENMESIIELFVKDSRKSAKFYQDLFNFQIIKDEDNGNYIGMKCGNVRIAINTISSLRKNHFFRPEIENQRLGLGVEIVLEVKDIESLYEKVKAKYPIEGELKLQPWGKKDFRVEDPDGYYVRLKSL